MGICPHREVNMRKVFVALTAAFALVAFLSACGMGLEPAKTDTTRVSFTFAVSSTMDSAGVSPSSRAIIPDGGYLYVRMIGGPTAPNTKYLGPFQVTGRSPTVSIDKIPAGAYDYMFLLYTESLIHDEMIPIEGPDGTNIKISMGDFLSLPDELFLEIMEDDDDYEYETQPVPRNIGLLKNEIPFGDWDDLYDGPDEIELLFAGRASTGVIENPVIVEGTNNPFDVTMIPITPYWIQAYQINVEYLEYLLESLDRSYDGTFKGFIEIYDLDYLYSHHSVDRTAPLTLTFSNAHETGFMTVNHLSIYDGDGKRISPALPSAIQLAPNKSRSFEITVPDYDGIFFYLDVSGGKPALTLSLDDVVEPEEPVEVEPEYPEMTTITGSIDLADYVYNFDTVFFSTTPAVSLEDLTAWNTAGETPTEGIVGWGGLTANETNGYHDFTGTIYSDFADTALYLIIVGEKYGQTVLYASTDSFTVYEMSYLTPAMTPLLQYVVVIFDDWVENDDDIAITLSIRDDYQNTVIQDLSGTIQLLPDDFGYSMYGAIIPLPLVLSDTLGYHASILTPALLYNYDAYNFISEGQVFLEIDFSPQPAP